MRPPFVFFAYFLFIISIRAQQEEISQEQLTQKVEVFILERKLDSAAFFLNRLKKNSYTTILGKIRNRELVSYVDYDLFLKTVSNRQSIGYLSVSNFINDFVKEPDNFKKINSYYVDIKWYQVGKLRNEVTLEAATAEHKKLEVYIGRFNDSEAEVLRAKTVITTHPIVMYSIKKDLRGKDLCLKSIGIARALKDIKLEITILYYLTDFLVLEKKLQEFIDVSERSLVLEEGLSQNTAFYHGTLEHLIDAYIFKGGHKERVKSLLNELYENNNSRIDSYKLYAKFISKLERNAPEKKEILKKFQANNVLELVQEFIKLGKDLNQLDFSKLIGSCAKALVSHGFYKESIGYKDRQIELVKNIYSKDLSETLANYKTELAVKEKEIEITSQKERTRVFLIIACLVGVFLLISLFNLRKIRRQSKELLEKNKLVHKSLKQKELLVKEVHHRVKNNFQIMSSLLELQSRGIEDERALERANEGKNRVKSMALIHQKLYENKSGVVDFDEYIELLVKELSSLYKSDNKIEIRIASKNMEFDVDTAVPLGLIINELITNSFKYAFSSNKKNSLTICINKEDKDNFKLIIEDNGPGLSNYFDAKKTKNLGLLLVSRLVKQLNGTLKLSSEKGARFEIIFKDIHARKLVD